jgi:hypothetical protein
VGGGAISAGKDGASGPSGLVLHQRIAALYPVAKATAFFGNCKAHRSINQLCCFFDLLNARPLSLPLGNIRQGRFGHQQGIGNRAGVHRGGWCWQIVGYTLQCLQPAADRGDGAGVAVYEYCNIVITLIGAGEQVQ